METVFVFCVVHVHGIGCHYIRVLIYTLVTKTICSVSTGYKNNSVTKTIRLQKHIERGYKNIERVPPPKGYKNRWGLGGLVEWVTKTLFA